jgi:methanesulfonate monooxygenase small subunit
MTIKNPLDPVSALVTRTCMYLDNEEYDKYLDLLHQDCRYSISYFSPDIKKEMVLLEHDKKGLADLLHGIHNHIRLPGRLMRQASVYTAEPDGSDGLTVTSYVTVIHTDLDGTSKVFCAGRYRDLIRFVGSNVQLVARDVRLDTRDLGAGCHYPI